MAIMMIIAALLCSTGDQPDFNTVTQVVYHFQDSSVPPEYHRSYTVTATADSVIVVVDCYGEILAQESYPSDSGVLSELLETFQDAGLNTVQERENEGCTGGTTESVTLKYENDVIFSGWVYHCGGEDFGTLAGNVEIMAEAMRSLVPDLDDLKE